MGINNNQVYTVMRTALAQTLGEAAIANVGTLSDIVDLGKSGANVSYADIKEQLTGALIGTLTRNWFTDTSYRSQYRDPFYKDSVQFGAIVQAITVDVPEVQASHAWNTFTSGTAIGTYNVTLPTIETKYYFKSNSWELPITVTYEQWDTAFDSEEGIRELVAYILMCVDNALVIHMDNLNMINRNNFILEKIAAQNGVFNLVSLYQTETGDTSISTAEAFLNTPKCMLFASEKIRVLKSYMSKMSNLYNTGSHARFVPEGRLVIQMLTAFEEKMKTIAMSDVYHKDIVELPAHESIPFWQGFGSDGSFDEVSKIDAKIKINGTDTEKTKSGVVAFLCDEYAIMHTICKQRVAVKDFNPEALTMYFYQFRDKYANNLTFPAIVLTVEDIQ